MPQHMEGILANSFSTPTGTFLPPPPPPPRNPNVAPQPPPMMHSTMLPLKPPPMHPADVTFQWRQQPNPMLLPNTAAPLQQMQPIQLMPQVSVATSQPTVHRQPIQPSPQSHTISQPAAQQPTAVAPNDGWAQHTHEGRVFYHNSLTKVSTYERPACFGPHAVTTQSTVTFASAQQNSTETGLETSNSATPAQQQLARKWRTYTDEKSGKKYYSDGVTTTWTCPPELNVDAATSSSSKTNHVSKKRRRDSQPSQNTNQYASKSEAIAAFKGLLLAKAISPTFKWNDVQKLCQDDTRWTALSTVGERKQALAEYQTKRWNELRELKRIEAQRGKEAFHRLLKEVFDKEELNNQKHHDHVRYENYRDVLSKDDRFHVVAEEEMRTELFYDYVEERRKNQDRQKRLQKQQVKENFVAVLRSFHEAGKLSYASTWSSFLAGLNDDESSNPKFIVNDHLSDSDRQLFFADYVLTLQHAEEMKHRKITEAKQRAEKAQRNAFRDALRKFAEEGHIRPNTRWRSVQELLGRHPSYDPVYAQRREGPRELFEDFLEEWNEEYRRERGVLLRAWGNAGKDVAKRQVVGDENLSLEEFRRQLLENASGVSDLYAEVRRILSKEDKLSTCILLYEEHVARASEENKVNDCGGDESSEDEGEIIEQE